MRERERDIVKKRMKKSKTVMTVSDARQKKWNKYTTYHVRRRLRARRFQHPVCWRCRWPCPPPAAPALACRAEPFLLRLVGWRGGRARPTAAPANGMLEPLRAHPTGHRVSSVFVPFFLSSITHCHYCFNFFHRHFYHFSLSLSLSLSF